MKTEKSINIEFQQVSRQVDALKECAGDLDRAAKQLRDFMESLRPAWQGESAELYLQKCEALAQKIQKNSDVLDQTAGIIYRSAQSYRNAEIKALEIFSSGGNGGGGGSSY